MEINLDSMKNTKVVGVIESKDGVVAPRRWKLYVAIVEIGSETEDDLTHTRDVADYTMTEEMDLDDLRLLMGRIDSEVLP